MKNIKVLGFITVAAALAVGCASVVKQNIISTVNTGIGISVAPNQNQVHEIKAGFIRSQFYSVPTGKTFDTNGNAISGAANVAPQLVSGIKMHSGIENMIVGMDVSENFAVGDVAVNSYAAIAMYIANAENTNNANAAQMAINAKAIAGRDYQADLNKLATIAGPALTKDASDLVDKITTVDQFKAALQIGYCTKVLNAKDVTSLTQRADAGKLDEAKQELKKDLIAFSPTDVANLSQFVSKLKENQQTPN